MARRRNPCQWLADIRGAAVIEVALLMPIMLTLLLGVVDIGNALLVDKKTVTAAQVAADLMTRRASVTTADIEDAYAAARMTIDPYARARFGMDVASIQFQGTPPNPVVLWRETYDMDENGTVLAQVAGLGVQGEGVIVVTTEYRFEPLFTKGIIGERVMREVAITRPRRGSYVARED